MLSELFNTPVEVDFHGKKLKLTRLDSADIAEFDERIKDERLRELNERIKNKLIPGLFHQALCLELCREETLVFDILRSLATRKGLPIGVWMCLRKQQPNIALEDIQAIPIAVLYDSNLGAKYLKINALVKESESGEEEAEPEPQPDAKKKPPSGA